MTDFEAKKAILDVGKRMYDRGFVAANDGNISCKVGPNALWTTPTGVSKGFMTQDMLVKVDLDGKVLLGRSKPSSELKMHLRVYKENPELMAVTHAHPPVATAFAIAGIPLDQPILTEAILVLGTIPIAHYATPGTYDVPDSIAPFVNSYNGCLLANHGALTWGKDVYQAFYRLESVEYVANITMYTNNIIGRQNELSCGQIDDLLEIRKNMGITAGGIPPCRVNVTNMQDIVSSQPTGAFQAQAQTQAPAPAPAYRPAPTVGEGANLPGTTSMVYPAGMQPAGCGCTASAMAPAPARPDGRSKEEIIAEVVRRVTQQLK